jgi:hypothetical protein
MKTTALIIGLLGLGMGVNAQSIMDKLYDKYSGTEGYTSVYISKYMFDMFRSDETGAGSKEDEMGKLLSKLNGIKILVTDDDPATPQILQGNMKVLPSSRYKDVRRERSGHQVLRERRK